jgi:predicted ArsR family transcriptional regulator
MAQGDDAGAFETTRGKLLLELCRGPRTVNELAEALGLTDNAVRAQLAGLQENDLVRQVGLRPGFRKPHAEYELTPEARRLFPQAHEQVLRTLVDVLRERLPADRSAALLAEAARRLLGGWAAELRAREPRRRLAELFRKLQGLAAGISVEEQRDRAVVRACGCPLASVTADHPQVCAVVAEVLSELLGGTVREKCDRTESPRCCFELTTGDAPAPPDGGGPA